MIEVVADRTDLDATLRAAGATDEELQRARAEGWLPLLALDRTLLPGRPTYSVDELAASVGVPREVLTGLWRALGFPDVPPGVRAFTEADAATVRALFARAEEHGGLDAAGYARLQEQIRVVSGALARIAAVEADEVAQVIEAHRNDCESEDEVALELLHSLDWGNLAALVDYAHRVQLRAALWRRMALPELGRLPQLAVGFADIAGYTALAQDLDDTYLADLLSSFERAAYDAVAEHGARIVKSIGDAVMYVGLAQPVAAAALALTSAPDGVPPLRQGVAYGPLLERDGDYFGPTVNLASRLSDVARPATVLASESMRDVLADDADLVFRSLRPRRLRGIGEVRVYALRRKDVELHG